MIGYYNYTVLFTLFGTLCGVQGIREAILGNVPASLFCLMLCGFFDMFDGTIARTKKSRTEFEKKYGVQLDSLSDVICFGVLPLVISLEVTKSLGIWSILSILYLVTAISRLAYFNVEEEMRSRIDEGPRKTYTGFPVTLSAIFLPLLYLVSSSFSEYGAIIFLFGLFLFAALQVSRFQLPHLNWKGLLICLGLGIVLMCLLMMLFR